MKFLVDMPLSPRLAAWLRTEGHDAVHASEISLSQAPDKQILSSALEQARVIITADLDFTRLVVTLGANEPGLILLRGGNYSESESLHCVRRVLMANRHDEVAHSIIVVDQQKIRRRRLPV